MESNTCSCIKYVIWNGALLMKKSGRNENCHSYKENNNNIVVKQTLAIKSGYNLPNILNRFAAYWLIVRLLKNLK
jgi:hypothetical protein